MAAIAADTMAIDGTPIPCDLTEMSVRGRRVLATLGSAAVVGSCWVTGCAGEGSGDARMAVPSAPTVHLTSSAGAAATASTPAATAAPSPVPPEPKPVLGADHLSVAPCESDADCGWDDPCAAERCMAAVASDIDVKCSESRPAPGACLCLSGGCTLKPIQTPEATEPCEDRGCVVDRAGGRCIADTRGVKENFRTNSGVDVGPSCDCLSQAAGCAFTWYESVPCKTVRDCWVEEVPRPHPVKRPAHLRGRDFKPCSDGEISPQCSRAGQCVLGGNWFC